MREKTYDEVCIYLENASPNEIFKYFETENKIRFYLKDPIIIKFIAKKNKLIDLALARYSSEKEIVEYFYENSKDKTIKLAALRNEVVTPHLYFWQKEKINLFVKSASSEELKVFFRNRNLTFVDLENILKRKNSFELITDEKFKLIVLYLFYNPYIHNLFDDELRVKRKILNTVSSMFDEPLAELYRDTYNKFYEKEPSNYNNL
jgi:hypothetical protein